MSVAAMRSEEAIASQTDHYFKKTKALVERYGDRRVTYAVFMRRPVVFTPKLMVEGLNAAAAQRGVSFDIELRHKEGEWVGAGEPLVYITGSLYHLVDLETLYLQSEKNVHNSRSKWRWQNNSFLHNSS